MSIDPNKKIIVDADVLIHFIKGGLLGELASIFPNKLYIFKEVSDEIWGASKAPIENMIKSRQLNELSIMSDMQVFKEFARLKKRYGAGESACMAYCRYNKDVLASSNLKDIKAYCKAHSIQYLTTMHFLKEAYLEKIFTEEECNHFIAQVRKKGSKLPCRTIQEYLTKYKS